MGRMKGRIEMGDGGVHGHCMGEFMGESWGGGTGGQVVGELPWAVSTNFLKFTNVSFLLPGRCRLHVVAVAVAVARPLTRCHVEYQRCERQEHSHKHH